MAISPFKFIFNHENGVNINNSRQKMRTKKALNPSDVIDYTSINLASCIKKYIG